MQASKFSTHPAQHTHSWLALVRTVLLGLTELPQ